jgi:hypothetical protein
VKLIGLVLKPVRPVWSLQGGKFGFCAREESRFGSRGRGTDGWSGESAGGQFARRSPSCAQYGDGRSRSFEIERRDDPRFFFRGFGPPPGERVGSLIVVTVVVFVEVALVEEVFWIVLTPLLSK